MCKKSSSLSIHRDRTDSESGSETLCVVMRAFRQKISQLSDRVIGAASTNKNVSLEQVVMAVNKFLIEMVGYNRFLELAQFSQPFNNAKRQAASSLFGGLQKSSSKSLTDLSDFADLSSLKQSGDAYQQRNSTLLGNDSIVRQSFGTTQSSIDQSQLKEMERRFDRLESILFKLVTDLKHSSLKINRTTVGLETDTRKLNELQGSVNKAFIA